MKIRINKAAVTTIIAIQLLWAGARGESGEPSSNWSRGILGTRVVPLNGPEFDMGFVTEESGELVGRCTLANVHSGSYDPVRLIIEGEWRHGLFWPTIKYQVGNLYKGPWSTIGSRSSKGAAARVVVKPGDIITSLRVSLEPFRKYIGKYQVGRVVLTSGDAGVFELKHLKAP